MKMRLAGAIAATSLLLLARAASAAPASDIPGAYVASAGYFQAAAHGLHRAERQQADASDVRGTADRTSGDESGGGTFTDNRLGYAAVGALMLGVVASFILGPRAPHELIVSNDPVVPTDPPSTPNPPRNEGDPQPPVPPITPLVVPEPTVTPEPATLMLLATGLSTLGAAGLGRRRRTTR